MKQIVLIVGASGVGKDTLLRNIENKLNANFTKRYITREPDQNEQNYYIDNEAFEKLKTEGFFVSTWEAHNNKYAIAKNQIKDGLNIISISRGAIKDFEKHFDNVFTIEITLPKEILYKRLKNRGRESEEEIEKRLNRSYKKIDAKHFLQFDNSSSVEESTEKFISILKRIQDENKF